MTWPSLPTFRSVSYGFPTFPGPGAPAGPVNFGTPVAPTSPCAPKAPEEILLSASQVDTFLSCARKWAFRSIWKIDGPPDSSAILGTAVHSVAEDYLTAGKEPDVHKALRLPKGGGYPGENEHYPGAIFQAGRHLNPAPGTVYVEGRKKWRTPVARWQGQMDGLTVLVPPEAAQAMNIQPGFRYPYDRFLDGNKPLAPRFGERLTVLDHKSTSDFKYQKQPHATAYNVALQDDVQANLYAWAALQEFPTDLVDLLWIYYRTRGRPEARKTHITVSREHVTGKIQEIDKTARVMLDLYQLRPQISELPPTTSQCGKYGGCPYRDRCPLTFAQRFTTMSATPIAPTQDFTQIVNQLRAQQAAGGLPPAGALPTPAEAPQPAPAAAPVQPAQPAPAPAAQQVPWHPGQPMNPAQEWMLSQPAVTWAALANAVNPGEPRAPEEIAASWDAHLLPPHQTQGRPVPKNSAPPANQLAGFPTPSVGGMNPPDAPPFQASQPSEMPQRIETPFSQPAAPAVPQAQGGLNPAMFEGLDRNSLKSLCESKGLCKSSCRLRDREPFIQALITGVPIPDPASAPSVPPGPPNPQTGFAAMVSDPTPAAAPFNPPMGGLYTGISAPAAQPAPAPSVDPALAAHAAAVATIPPAPAETPAYSGGYCLLVHCMPVTNPAALGIQRLIRLADIWREVQPQVEQIVKAPHYAMVDFGKGRGLFAGLVQEWLIRNNVGPGVAIQVDPTPEGTDALTTLERFAGPIIRGGK